MWSAAICSSTRLIQPSRVWRAICFAALTAGALGSVAPLDAQNRGTVTGRVTDATSGAPMGQVQVFIPGLSLGTLTRTDGQFLMVNVPAGTHTLRAERIGMQPAEREVTVTSGGTIDVMFQLQNQALGLDEIVVTGTPGVSRRREIGNTINQVSTDERLVLPQMASQLLQAAAPGVDVMTNGGDIGQGSRITLRGNASIATSNTPIIYVDGIRMKSDGFEDTHGLRSAHVTASPLDLLNPNDIERIEVIKGSAATTLYGTEAAAGVIQVFTRRGSSGAAIWTLEATGGTTWSTKFGIEPEPYFFMDDFLRRGYGQTFSGSVRGGGSNLQYFLSGLREQATGIMPLDELGRYVVRGNFTFTPATDLLFQWNSSYSRSSLQNTPTGRNSHGITQNAFRQSGNYFSDGHPDVVGQNLDWDIFQDLERMTSGGSVTFTPAERFTSKLTIGYDYSLQEARDVRPFGFALLPAGNVFNRTWQQRLLSFEQVSTIDFDLGGIGSSFSFGAQAVGDDRRWLEGEGEGIPGLGKNATVSSAAQRSSGEGREKVWNVGGFAQNVFNVGEKYFITVGARVDGNSTFGDDFGLQFYPKLSGTWILSDEDFWRGEWGELKLRAAYGASGRAPDAFAATRTWLPQGWMGTSAFLPGNFGSGNLGPEVTHEIEVGFDGSWLEGRLGGSLSYFRQKTVDALINVPGIPSTGFSTAQLQNVGEILNWGTEATVDLSVIQRPSWGWDLGLNVMTNQSKAVDLGGREEFSALMGTVKVGYPVPIIVGRRVVNPDEIADPIIEEGHIYGQMMPTLTSSVSTTVRMPYGIALSARGEYRGGHVRNIATIDVARQAPAMYCNPYYVDVYQRYETGWVARLKDDTPAIWRARCDPTLFNNSYYQFASDFFRLREVTLQVPVDYLMPTSISSAVMTFSLNNAFLWTKLPWWDPETLPQAGGVNAVGFGQDQDEKVPGGSSFQASLRVTF